MATTHTAAMREDFADAFAALANAGSQVSARIFDASNNLLVTINIPDFTVSGEVATSDCDGDSGTAAATGTASYGIIYNGSAEVCRGGVGVGSGEFQISSTSIASGDTVTLTTDITWTAPS